MDTIIIELTLDEARKVREWGDVLSEYDDWDETDEGAMKKIETAITASEGGLGDGETPDAGGSEVEDERQMEFDFDE